MEAESAAPVIATRSENATPKALTARDVARDHQSKRNGSPLSCDAELLNPAGDDAGDVVGAAVFVRAFDQAMGGGGQIGRAADDL
jgi:hypothetical protein